ncbi:MAG TPA: GGDEF domain-containing protein [Polyangiaceae bacterium]
MGARLIGDHADLPSGERPVVSNELTEGATPQMDVSPAVVLDRATLTMLAGPDAGAILALESPEVVLGRTLEAPLRIDEPSVSRWHAVITCSRRGVYTLEDLGSKNGTYVGGKRIRVSTLHSGDRIHLGPTCALRFSIVDETEEAAQRQLYELAMRDSLTAVSNRRCLMERLHSEVSQARRDGGALSVLLLDIDHFKAVNDTFGHLAGDRVLCAMSAACAAAVRTGDIFARYGGEEFAVVARDADLADALRLAERLCALMRSLRVEAAGRTIPVTMSIGVASLSECPPDASPADLLARADHRLYEAKSGGRDRACGADAIPPVRAP